MHCKTPRTDALPVRKLFSYDPSTGDLRWLPGQGRSFSGKSVGRRVRINKVLYLRHRLIWLWMTGEWPTETVDHINGNSRDDRWKNLREATVVENNRNVLRKGKLPAGVEFHGRWWRARLCVDGRRIIRSGFATREEAEAVYRDLAATYFQDFAPHLSRT